MKENVGSGASRRRLFLMGLGIAGAVGYLIVIVANYEKTFVLSPKTPRIWAEDYYRKHFLVGSPGLKSPDTTPNYLIIDGANPDQPHEFSIQFHAEDGGEDEPTELFRSDEQGKVSLPGGSNVFLEGMVLGCPWLADWSHPAKSPKLPLEWVNPFSGDPLNEKQREDLPKSWTVSSTYRSKGPELFLYFRTEEKSPVSILGLPSVFEANAKYASGYSGLSSHNGNTIYSIRAPGWHRHSLEVTIDVLYGDPEIRSLPAAIDDVVHLGGGSQIRLLKEIPWHPGTSSGSSIRPDGQREWRLKIAGGNQLREDPILARIYGYWPPRDGYRLQLRELPGLPFKDRSTSGGVFWWEGQSPADFAKMEVRRLPHHARLVFTLPEFSQLPEVKNQFETPIPNLYFKDPNELAQAIRIGAGVGFTTSRDELDESRLAFPMEVDNTSPMELIRLYERMLNYPLNFDEVKMTLEAEPKELWVEKVEKWWKSKKPLWLR